MTAAAAFALGGCTSPASDPPPTHVTPAMTPLQTADADANESISSFGRLPHAVKLSATPTGLVGVGPDSDQVVEGEPLTLDQWYRVPVGYNAALAEAEALLPSWAGSGATPHTTEGVGIQGIGVQRDFGGAAIARREIQLVAYALSPTTSAVQVEVTDDYRPTKTAVEAFPTTGVLDVDVRPAVGPATAGKSFTVTDPKVIARVAGILDALPTVPITGVTACPAMGVPARGTGPVMYEVELTFHATANAPAVVSATVKQTAPSTLAWGGCDGDYDAVWVAVGKTGQPELDPTGKAVYAQVMQAVGYERSP
ncbi:hypothetical protein KDL01_12815 [Actinospica durhamensis]|uniref:Uncharacterized protein n=1 Tax=Actinospica durhamensis TaxID=1508375 RepID=A0A941INM8_9ACTN|nr:hypothetical protein [Actinospica durhamensis]MBR7834149.1 hypothetical protein [Actinospica durhamensis]